MRFQTLIEFRYLRDLMLIFVINEKKIKVNNALLLRKGRSLHFSTHQMNSIFKTYKRCLTNLFPNTLLLFPTEDGNEYMLIKFQQNIRKLLVQIGQSPNKGEPSKLTPQQITAILELRFSYQRPVFQLTLSGALLGYMALRASEVAKLRKEDFNIEQGILYLRDTKSQEDQQIDIHPDLLEPLRAYLKHLKPKEALFIRDGNRKQWERKDVHRGIEKISSALSIPGVFPRRLRSTVACQMLRRNIPINVVAAILRHKDTATTLRHYAKLVDLRLTKYGMTNFHPTRPVGFDEKSIIYA